MKILPYDGPVSPLTNGLGMAHNIFFKYQNLFLADDGQIVPEKGAVYQGVIEMVKVVVIETFPTFLERFRQVVEGPGSPHVFVGKRVNAKEAHEPLIEDKLVAEGMLFWTFCFFSHGYFLHIPSSKVCVS